MPSSGVTLVVSERDTELVKPLALVVLRIRLHSHPTSKEVGFLVQKSL